VKIMSADKEKGKDKGKAAPAPAVDDGAGAKKKKLILFGGIGGAVAAIAAGAFFMMRGPSTPHDLATAEGEAAESGHDSSEKAESGHDKGAAPAAEEGHGGKKKEAAKSGEHGKADGGQGKKEEGKAGEHGKAEEAGGKKEENGKGGEGHGKKEEKAETVDIDFGRTYNLKTFHLNLGNPLENRFLRMEISVEYKGGDPQKAELEARAPQLRDAVVNVTGKKTREFLLGPDGKDQLRLEVLNRINQFMDRKIEAVYITDFLIE
jgi:flagellar FliL protein